MPLRPVRCLAFSDVHHASYSTGVTLEDTVRVERVFNTTARIAQADFCLFAGDRYLSHNPEDWIRLEADRVQAERDREGFVTFSLVGNHDLWAKAPTSGHSNRQVQQLWAALHPNLVVMDEVRTYEHPRVPGVRIHALPAGFAPDLSRYDLFGPGEGWNILAFHGLVQGSLLNRSGYRAGHGLQVADLDHPAMACVLGGDVHAPQRLPFHHTVGGYIGSCIQQSRRDRGEKRGFLQVDLVAPPTGVPSRSSRGFSSTFWPSPCPLFLEFTWDVDQMGAEPPTADEVADQLAERWGVTDPSGNILDLALHGRQEALRALPRDWWRPLGPALGLRRINPPVQHVRPALETAPTIGGPRLPLKLSQEGPLGELRAWFASGRAPIGGHDPQTLAERASRLISP
jgi:hypothetical protein